MPEERGEFFYPSTDPQRQRRTLETHVQPPDPKLPQPPRARIRYDNFPFEQSWDDWTACYARTRQHNVPADNLVPFPQQYQSWGGSATALSVTATAPNPTRKGDLLLAVGITPGGTASIADQFSNVYTAFVTPGTALKVWWAVANVASDGNFIQTTLTSTTSAFQIALSAIEITGVLGLLPIDVSAAVQSITTNQTAGPTPAPQYSADLAVGLVATSGAAPTGLAFSPALAQTIVEDAQGTTASWTSIAVAACDPSQALSFSASQGVSNNFLAVVVLVKGGQPIPQPLAYSKKPWDAFNFEQSWDDWVSLYAHRKFLDTHAAAPYNFNIPRERTPLDAFGMDAPWDDWASLYESKHRIAGDQFPLPPVIPPPFRKARTPYDSFGYDQPWDDWTTLYGHRRYLDWISRTGVPRRRTSPMEFFDDDPNWVVYAAPHRRSPPPQVIPPWWPKRVPPFVQLHQWDEWLDLYTATHPRRSLGIPGVAPPAFPTIRRERTPWDAFNYDQPWDDWTSLFGHHFRDVTQPPPPPPPFVVDTGAPIMAVDLNPVRGYDDGVQMASDLNPVHAKDLSTILAADLNPIRGSPR